MSSSDDFEMEEVQVPAAGDGGADGVHGVQGDAADAADAADTTASTNLHAASSDDDQGQWEEVDADVNAGAADKAPENLQITLDKSAVEKTPETKTARPKRAGPSPEERAARLHSHKIHAVALLANAKHRNKLLNDELLHARMLSLVPIHYQLAFSALTPSNIPDPIERSRLFDKALKRLMDWWRSSFEIDWSLLTPLTKPYADVQEELKSKRKGRQSAQDNDQYEVIRSEKSLQKRALQMRGSRDMSAQLFTALCRALNVPARLVVSLQAVPYRVQSQTATAKPAVISLDDSDAEAGTSSAPDTRFMTWEQRQKSGFKGTDEAFIRGEAISADRAPPIVRLSSHQRKKKKNTPNKSDTFDTQSPPIFWTEVFSRPDGKWIVVDPIRNMIRTKARNMMDPGSAYKYNKMTYVIAFEEDGYAKDVTARYAKQYGTRTVKQRPPTTKNGGDWWERVMSSRGVARPYRLARDDVEDAELHQAAFSEPMPQSMQGFKDHPVYVLARHLKREEVVNPPREIGRFKGEVVYPRANVQLLKTSENWLRQGRVVVEGAQPLKRVKQRAVTIGKRRAQEAAALAGEEELMQGLYSRAQTELYQAPPVVDGRVPKNKFGNIDLYTPTMLPQGGAHLPQKGIAKIAKKLGVDYGEAVTGFEFRQRKANPVLTGIVVDATQKEAVVDAYEEWQSQQAEKELEKQTKEVYKQWQKLVQGLRIRERLKEYRGADMQPHEQGGGTATKKGAASKKKDSGAQPTPPPPPSHLPSEIKQYAPGTYEQSLDTITKAQKALPARTRVREDGGTSTADEAGIDEDLEEVGVESDSEMQQQQHSLEVEVPAKLGQPVTLDALIQQQEEERKGSAQKVAEDADSTHVPETRLRKRPSSLKRARQSSSENTQQRVTRSRVSRGGRNDRTMENERAVKVALEISDEEDANDDDDDDDDDLSDAEVHAPVDPSSDDYDE
ncbi:hypothetical protein E3P99_01568 [Wallemia hederae]|uniref:Rad4 beta-hairpin domain-containing protein n=1 Tax=Wallemia hederae TaxID=1540922 RepID=A0A4T0FPS6_9BASI|nr:hypothetical protein E3P99_01568 [Wallemia hederae]